MTRTEEKPLIARCARLRAVFDSFDLDLGDRINVATGNYLLTNHVVIANQDSGVTIQGPSGGGAVFNRQNDANVNGEYAFNLQNADNIAFDSITVTGAEIGIYAANGSDSDDLAVRNSQLFGNQLAGILLGFSNDRLSASNNQVYGLPGGITLDDQTYGISLRDTIDNSGGNDHVIEGNNIFDNSIGLNLTGLRTEARNNQIHGNSVGIRAYFGASNLSDGLRITDNEIFSNTAQGIDAFGIMTITGNEVYGHTSTNYAVVARNAAVSGNTIRNNVNGLDANSTVANNRIFGQTSIGLNLASSFGGVQVVDSNSVYSNSIGIRGASNFTNVAITNNLVYANINRGLLFENSSAGANVVYVWNNTIYQQVGDAVRLQSSARNIKLSNNIITILSGYAINVDNTSQTGFSSDYNVFQLSADPNARVGFWNNDCDTLVIWQSGSSGDVNSLSADPLFIDINGADNRFGYSGGIDGGADDNFYRLKNSPATDRGDSWNSTYLDRDQSAPSDDLGVVNAGRLTLSPNVLASNQFTATGIAQPSWRGNSSSFSYTFAGGFTFPFFGTAYSSVNVSTEGFLQFGPAVDTGDGNNSISSLVTRPRIAALWDNIRTNGTGDDLFVDSTVAGQVKFRWNATNEATNGDVQFSITLFSSGTIRFDYGPGNSDLTPTVGISSGNGETYEIVPSYDAASSLANANSVEFNLAPGKRDLGAYEFRGQSNDLVPPTITAVTPQAIGVGGQTAADITQIELTLSEPLLALSTLAPNIYELRSSGTDNIFGNSNDVLFGLTPTYDSISNRILLAVAGGPVPAGLYRLAIASNSTSAIVDLSGNILDGDANSVPGGDYIREFQVIVNSAPVLSGSYDFPSIAEDIPAVSNPGQLVLTLLAGRISDPSGPASGIAVGAVNNLNGVWEYTLDGIAYQSIAPQLGPGRVLLLAADATTRIRFLPNANYFGIAGAIHYRAWDQADGTFPGSSVLLSSLTVNSLSETESTASITVNVVNDAPSDIQLTSSTIREKLPIGTVIGQFSSLDIDSVAPFAYSLVEGAGSIDNSRFEIVGNELRLAEVLDFEALPNHSIRVQTTDLEGASFEKAFVVQVLNAPPRVTGLYVRGSGWNSSYLAMLAANNLGSALGGFQLIAGPNQLANASLVTWQTINQISATFDEGAVVNPIALRLLDGNNQDLGISATSFNYDVFSRTAQWTLNSPLVAGKYLISLESSMIVDGGGAQLDGEWMTSVDTYATSGNDSPGGDLNFRFNYLPGDVTRNAQTNPGDVNLLRSLGTIIPGAANFWRDVTGNNQINPGDVNFVRSLGTIVLPSAEPSIPPPLRSPLIAAQGYAGFKQAAGKLLLTQAYLDRITFQAIEVWSGAGVSHADLERLRAVSVTVGNYGSSPYLGMSFADRIVIDDNAAGWGWDMDEADSGGMDLLSVVLHEMGHQLGLSDLHETANSGDLMHWQLGNGQRRRTSKPLDPSICDALFGSEPFITPSDLHTLEF